jgi:hypothetical protein
MRRLATSTKARSANGTPLARPSFWSRIDQRPSWSNKARTTRTGPSSRHRGLAVERIACVGGGVTCQEAAEPGEDLDEEVLTAQIGDDALLDLSAVAVGLDDADIFVDGAAGRADFDGSGVHEKQYHDVRMEN